MKQINMKDYTGKNYLVDGCVVRALDNLYVSTDINELFGGVDVATHCAETYNGKNYNLIYFYDDKAVRKIAKKSGMEHLLPDLGITNALVPVRHEEVEVCGERVLAAVTEDNKAYFSPRHVCDALGILWHGQYEKIKADPVLSSTVQEICTVAADGKKRAMKMLPIEYANGWLFTIKKVRPELQAKLNLFRTEGYAALDAWFRQGLRNDPEVQAKFKVPQSLAEALEFAAEQVRKSERLEAENKVLSPKAVFSDLKTDNGERYLFYDACKGFGVSATDLRMTLLRHGILIKRVFPNPSMKGGKQNRYIPREQYIEGGYFVWRKLPNGCECHDKYHITPKGLRLICQLLMAEGLLEEVPAWLVKEVV